MNKEGLKSFLKRLRDTPPQILVRKIRRLYQRQIREKYIRKKDERSSSYTQKEFSSTNRIKTSSNFSLTGDLFSLSDKINKTAKNCLNHRFDLLGSGLVQVAYGMKCAGLEGYLYNQPQKVAVDLDCNQLENFINPPNLSESKRILKLLDDDYVPIDWQLDFKSGYRWDSDIRYTEIIYGLEPGVDVKVPWELARMQHLPQLAVAYSVALRNGGDTKKVGQYRREFRNEILDFMATNPPRFGVNWCSTMDVGIRVANWLLSYDLFKSYGGKFDAEFEQEFIKSVYDHAKHIWYNFEWSDKLTSNHYLSNIAGLLFVSLYLPNSLETFRWRNFAMHEIQKEIQKQVYPDGSNFEASTCYHRLVLELFFFSAFILVLKDRRLDGSDYSGTCRKILGPEFTDKLYKMFDAVFFLLKPNGMMPQIGDNDSGQFIKLFPRKPLDMRYLLALGAVFFKESKWKISEFFKSEEDLAEINILYGEYGKHVWHNLPLTAPSQINPHKFENSGWYVLRDNDHYCVVSAGPNGQNGNGGHAHNDKLSFDLWIKGCNVVSDPGTFVYTPLPEFRNHFRSTAYHNTVMVDSLEQNTFINNSLFRLNSDAKVHCNKWIIQKKYNLLDATYEIFQDNWRPISVNRKILFVKTKNYWIIKDQVRGEGKHKIQFFFNTTGLVEIDSASPLMALIMFDNQRFQIASMTAHNKMTLKALHTWFSPSYGVKYDATAIVFETEAELPFHTNFLINSSTNEQ